MYYLPMRRLFLLGMIAFAALLGAGNNLVNPRSIDWLGSPEILPKPEGWPSLTVMQGISGGVKVAQKEINRHPGLVVSAALLLALLIRVQARRRRPASRVVFSWLRVALALMFLFAAWPKFIDPKGFAVLVAQYQFLPAFAVNAFSLWLPAFEILTGAVLLFTPFEREASGAVLLLLVMFIVALAQALARGLGIACGCFDIEGAADAGETWFSLLRDVALLAPVLWMWFKAERRYLWRF